MYERSVRMYYIPLHTEFKTEVDMGMTKQKLARLKILDQLLSNRYKNYSTKEMADIISDRIAEVDPDFDGVTQRTVQKDIKFLKDEWPVYIDFEYYSAPAYDRERQRSYMKDCVRYSDPGFSIFKKELSDDEVYLLGEAMSLLGQFDGLPNLEALENLRLSLGLKHNDKKIISLTKSPHESTNKLGKLFTAISQKQVIELHYHKFGQESDRLTVNLIPYLIKEYNRRWYLLAAVEENGKILNFGLERIDDIVPLEGHKYVEYDGDITKYFDSVIGVTLYDGYPILPIVFWVSDHSKDYVCSKYIHPSQEFVSDETEKNLRSQYPSLSGGMFFRIECRENYELIRELTSFGKELIVLEPSGLREMVKERIKAMNKAYKNL